MNHPKQNQTEQTESLPKQRSLVEAIRVFWKSKHLLVLALIAIVGCIGILLALNFNASRVSNSNTAPVLKDWKAANVAVKEGIIKRPGEILEISFSYDEATSPQLKITGLTRKNGYAPKLQPLQTGWKMEVVNSNKLEPESVYIDIPFELDSLPPLEGDPVMTPVATETNKKVDFVFTLKWPGQGSSLFLKDPNSTLVATQPLNNVPKEENSPNFHTINGEDIVDRSKASFKNIFRTPKASALRDGSLDIAIIGDDYAAPKKGATSQFQSDVKRVTEHLLTYEPFRSRASEIKFHFVENTTDLNCIYGKKSTTERGIVCDYVRVTQAINSAGVPYDEILVLVNNTKSGGAANGSIAVSYNGAQGPETAVHELGHSIAYLKDEYVFYNTNGEITNKVITNCYAGKPLAAEWSTIVLPEEYALGCYYPNWYRSSSTSIMKDTTARYFNKVSQALINKEIDLYKLPPEPEDPVIKFDLNCRYGKETILIDTDSRADKYIDVDNDSNWDNGYWRRGRLINSVNRLVTSTIPNVSNGFFAQANAAPGFNWEVGRQYWVRYYLIGSNTYSDTLTFTVEPQNCAASGVPGEGANIPIKPVNDNIFDDCNVSLDPINGTKHRTLRIGDKDDSDSGINPWDDHHNCVSHLQWYLKESYGLAASAQSDDPFSGEFDYMTEDSVVEFQGIFGVSPVSGTVGPLTWHQLHGGTKLSPIVISQNGQPITGPKSLIRGQTYMFETVLIGHCDIDGKVKFVLRSKADSSEKILSDTTGKTEFAIASDGKVSMNTTITSAYNESRYDLIARYKGTRSDSACPST